jgi:hypothetical protein
MKLEEANKLSFQELCDYSIQKIVEQGKRCGYISTNDTCVYFRCAYQAEEHKLCGPPKILHCAIGYLLDENNEKLMNRKGNSTYLIENYAEQIPAALVRNKRKTRLLQIVHDAAKKQQRRYYIDRLTQDGVDTSGPHWNAWVELGVEEANETD